jgi:hypothetical protein
MSLVFKDLGSEFLKVFVDDLNIHSKNWEDHLQHLEAVLAKQREVNLKLNPGKLFCCQEHCFFRTCGQSRRD